MAGSKGITLHPEFGVNPSLMICFWCGKESGIALLGKNKGKEAPIKAVFDYDPCTECKDNMAKGITLVELEPSTDTPEMIPGFSPSGRWWVVTEEMVKRCMPEAALLEKVLKERKAFIPPEVAKELGLYDTLPTETGE